MIILVTYNDILEVGSWEQFCEETGLNPYCINEGAESSTTVELTIEQAEAYGLIKLKKEE